MSKTSRLASVLLLTTALVAPYQALAQDGAAPPASTPPAGDTIADPAPTPPAEEEVEISTTGGEIIVTGARERNIARTSDQVVSVLSTAEIARTGEGNIAGALARVAGLSVVGSGYVYVRGLGDRYSLALLNGSPLPSPEPLKRVVPLDIFPSSVISSSLVQKTYSVNYPGEFGGGVINLTTRSVPRDPFISIGGGISGDTETTGQLGYVHYGSKTDWTGFDNGQRDIPPALASFLASGERISSGRVNTQAIASQLITSRNAVIQRQRHLPPNFSATLTAGKSFTLGGSELGVIFAAGYSNKWGTRDARQQSSLSADLSTLESDFQRITTDNRIVVNGLLGLALEFGPNKVRWTNLYIRDTIKQTRLGLGNRQATNTQFMQQDTAWFERQLIDTQLVGEFELAPGFKLDVRGTYANSQREAPGELSIEYVRTNVPSDPFGASFINILNNGNRGNAEISYSDLNENLWAGSIDATYLITPDISATVGGVFSDTKRTSSRRDFQFSAPSSFPQAVGLFRPDLLLQPSVINAFGISLVDLNEGNPAFVAKLRNYAGYAKLNIQATPEFSIDAGVRYEKAKQLVSPLQVFKVPGASTASTELNRTYWLPAATLTWQFQPDMQFRVNASKTIARPQFRELIYQPYFDPENNRQYVGNPLLIDSQLYNAEARFEYYFAPEQRLSVSAFYKKIENPIESFISGGDLTTSFANAPKATLYGAEVEAVKFYDLGQDSAEGSFMFNRRLVVTANYTFTKSKLQVAADDKIAVFASSSTNASDYFRDGVPLTGQSNHIANLQIGLENTERLSQQTLMITYASKRVVSRGLNGSPPQPDIIEYPGLRVDLVLREGFTLLGKEIEAKFEARNLTGRGNVQYQESGSNRIQTNSYDLGRSFSLSATMKF